ncbi:MAG TPA: cupin domain-containing protein [Anaerolineales bacterium]|nr:cupin domain-containing protein [Anaerolineales bacterium]
MARAGQILNNAYTGERIIFEQTEQDKGGGLLSFMHFMSPRKRPHFPEHVHLNQEEQFEILVGRARYRLDGGERMAHTGEVVIVPPGVRHINCWNPGPEELQMRHSLHPALGAEVFFETIFTLAMNGKTNAKGEVNLLQLAVIDRAIESETFNSGIPISLQRWALPILAVVGNLLGYRARYE